jgi:hypothetical protein
MKTTCLLNFLSFTLVLACNFEFSDIPYLNSIVENAYSNSLAFLKLLLKNLFYLSFRLRIQENVLVTLFKLTFPPGRFMINSVIGLIRPFSKVSPTDIIA